MADSSFGLKIGLEGERYWFLQPRRGLQRRLANTPPSTPTRARCPLRCPPRALPPVTTSPIPQPNRWHQSSPPTTHNRLTNTVS